LQRGDLLAGLAHAGFRCCPRRRGGQRVRADRRQRLLALAGYLAGYRGPTREAYTLDLLAPQTASE
jgi:hypothetical protein